MRIDGLLHSDVAGMANQCSNIGDAGGTGCPYADKTIIDLQIVDQQKSGICGYDKSGKPKSDCKMALSGVEVKVFDRQNADFIAAYGSRPDKLISNVIFESDVGKIGSCTTDINGTCFAGEDYPGKFIVVAKYIDGSNSVYTAKIKNFKNKVIKAFAEEEDDDDVDAAVAKDVIITKKLHFMKTIKKDGTVKYDAGAMTIVSGSQLNVLYPEYTVWDSNIELYPFVMSSDDSWTTDVCMQVPSGYKISGVMDAEGTVLGTSSCLQSFVAGQTKVILFQLTDIGSPEPNVTFSLGATHNGKKTQKSLSISGIRKAAKEKLDKDTKAKIKK
jgi:hypothetical protein